MLAESLHERVSGLANAIYTTNNQVQMHLTAIETQLDKIQRKLEEAFSYSCQTGEEQSLYRLYRLDDSIQ